MPLIRSQDDDDPTPIVVSCIGMGVGMAEGVASKCAKSPRGETSQLLIQRLNLIDRPRIEGEIIYVVPEVFSDEVSSAIGMSPVDWLIVFPVGFELFSGEAFVILASEADHFGEADAFAGVDQGEDGGEVFGREGFDHMLCRIIGRVVMLFLLFFEIVIDIVERDTVPLFLFVLGAEIAGTDEVGAGDPFGAQAGYGFVPEQAGDNEAFAAPALERDVAAVFAPFDSDVAMITLSKKLRVDPPGSSAVVCE